MVRNLLQRRGEGAPSTPSPRRASFTPCPTPAPYRPESNQGEPSQARTQSQAQPMVRTRTVRDPRQNATATVNVRSSVHGVVQHITHADGVTIRPAPSHTGFDGGLGPRTQSSRPALQPQKSTVVDANNRAPLAAEQGGRRLRLEFQYQNGWLICRNVETRQQFMLHVVAIMVSTLTM